MPFCYEDKKIKDIVLKGNFGIEKESLRVTVNGNLSHTSHPFIGNPYIDRDFCENQVELITDPSEGIDKAYNDLEIIHKQTVKSLYYLESGPELLWPFSSPPYILSEDDIPIARYSGQLKSKEYYREYLASKYGKRKMLFSGIHVNYSFHEEFLKEQFKNSHEKDYQTYKNNIYLELAQKTVQYSWLIVYLTAASPLLDGSFFDDNRRGEIVYNDLGSARCSDIGYWNDFIPVLNYTSLDTYVESIENYINNGLLKGSSELYYPVRLKPKGINSLNHLKQEGVNHIELRMLDLNPFSPINIMKEDIEFIHLLIIYLMSLNHSTFNQVEQENAIENEKQAARFNDFNIDIKTRNQSINIRELSLNILSDMEDFFEKNHFHIQKNIIQYQRNKIINHQRYVERVINEFSNQYVYLGVQKAKQYAENICKGE
jgi:glutamate--cysteine ligase